MSSNKKKPNNMDHKNFMIDKFDIAFGANVIFKDAKLVIEYRQHYALIGRNGIGKTSLLNMINDKKNGIPNDLDIVYVKQEDFDINKTVIETVLLSDINTQIKINKFNDLSKIINDESIAFDDDIFQQYNKISTEIGNDNEINKAKVHKILVGLGFSKEEHNKKVSDFSGGWRMRVSLAKALFMVPTLLILDEPTNHLDLYASLWLTNYLKKYPNTFIVVSHDKYFLNEICTTIIRIDNKKLNYYKGNLDLMEKQCDIDQKKYKKDYETYLKKLEYMRSSNKKTQKEIDAYIKNNHVQRPEKEYIVKINFIQPNILKGNLITFQDMDFGYNNILIYHNINFSITQESRIAIVGKNGIGKSTLLKLMNGNISPNSGNIIKSHRLKIGYYDQHFENSLPTDMTAVDYIMSLNNNVDKTLAHKYLSNFCLEPIYHKIFISNLSGGQKARVKLASFGVIQPHILILDEPSNHLDIVTIDSLINAINNFEGAVIVVTHNFDLITKMNCQLWNVTDEGIQQYNGDYNDYINDIIEQIEQDQ